MKRYFLLPILLMTFQVSFTQETEIANWISQNPFVYLMSQDNYDLMSQERKAQLKDRIVVFKNEITLDQLVAHTPLKSISAVSNDPARDADIAAVKEWLGLNQDVQIVPRSVYNISSDSEKAEYVQNHALILLGEEITAQDVRNY